MKKLLKLVPVILILCLLSGCYASDSTLKFNYDGTVNYDSTTATTKNFFEKIGQPNATDYIDQAVKYFNEDFKNNPGAYEEFSIEPYYPNGKPGEAGVDENSVMYGIKAHTKFSDFNSFTQNQFILNYTIPNITIRKYSESNTPLKSGIDIETKNTFFGTRYVGSGSINIFGNDEENLKREVPDYKTLSKNASAEITFKFPFSFFKSNASSKNILTNSLTWKVNGNDAQTVPVSFDVFVLNPVVLFESLIIIILLVLLFIFLGKKRDEEEEAPVPDEYYTDEEGNVIPVYYDEEGSDTDEHEGEDENELLDLISEDIESEDAPDADEAEILPESEPDDNSENDKSSDSDTE